MANGGIIGPVNTVSASQAEVITTVTSSTPSAVTLQPATSKINIAVVAGGGGGGSVAASNIGGGGC